MQWPVVTERLPVRVEPIAGEAIDSWLEATALHMGVAIGPVVRVLGLPAKSHAPWITWLDPDRIEVIADITGVLASVIEAMTLSVYDGTALRVDPRTRRLDGRFPYGAVQRSRFCPECLSESGGRWRLDWRLGWTFACMRHNSVLADHCPQCGEHQRRQLNYRYLPSPATCRCGHDLRESSSTELHQGHPIMAAQQRIQAVIDGNTKFGVFEENPSSVLEVLTTIRSWANRILNFAAVQGIAAVTVAELPQPLVELLGDGKPLKAKNALNDQAPSHAFEMAVAVTAALSILDAPTIADAGRRAVPYVEGQNADTGAAELRTCSNDGVIPAAVMIKASTPWMGPELQIRYRAVTTVPKAPNRGADRARGMAAALPTLIWPTWSDRLLPGLRRTVVARETLSWATLLAGSAIDTVAAAHLLKQPVRRNTLNQRLWVIRSSASWESICAGLITLSDYLDNDGAPIDYERRRQLDYSTLLSEEAWEQICSEVDGPIRHASAASARAYMVEVLTGCPTSRERHQRLRTGRKAEFRDPPRNMLGALDEHARSFLQRHGVHEPLSWHPPLDLLDVLDLPMS